ncbi:MAG: superoxide dismutase family protein [Nitrospira sp.]|nr:superoxide dismutase family protein [Nitrospira sp.]
MDRSKLWLIIGMIGALSLVGCTRHYTGEHLTPFTAKVVLSGLGIVGEATLLEAREGRVRLLLTLTGTPASKLTPGRHAIHIHETGQCEPFSAAQGHFDGNVDSAANPQANVSPGLENHPYHLGDLPNLLVTELPNGERRGSLITVTSRITLSPGLNTLFDQDGSALVIHELEDQYLPDPPNKDAPGGPRIACGVIIKG